MKQGSVWACRRLRFDLSCWVRLWRVTWRWRAADCEHLRRRSRKIEAVRCPSRSLIIKQNIKMASIFMERCDGVNSHASGAENFLRWRVVSMKIIKFYFATFLSLSVFSTTNDLRQALHELLCWTCEKKLNFWVEFEKVLTILMY